MEEQIQDDGLVIPEIGRWGKRKYHFLERYLEIFSSGMKDKWENRFYLDLFSAAGLARVRGSGELVHTSAMIAGTVRDPFTRLILCERDKSNAEALSARLAKLELKTEPVVLQGDANRLIGQMLGYIPQADSLCVTFADPFGLHFDFDTVRAIASRRSDLIILLPDRMDALRNWAAYYKDNPESTLDRFMGEPGWRDLLEHGSADSAAQRLRDRYIDRLRSVGYTHFEYERIQNERGVDLYLLVFACRHPRGLDFWNKAKSVDEAGQRSFDF